MSFLDMIGIATTLKLQFLVWFWFRGHDMVDLKEFDSDAGTLKMGEHRGPYRSIDIYIVNLPEYSKPLQAVVPPDFKGTQQHAQVYSLDSDDEIPLEIDDMLTQRD